MADVLRIKDVSAMCAELSKEQFVERLGPFVLVGQPKPASLFDDESEEHPVASSHQWKFATGTQTRPYKSSGSIVQVFADTNPVFPLRKRGAFANTFLVGRASSNDLCIDATSVSKLHARIHAASDGTMTISDAGSRNGTVVDGSRVTDTPFPINHRSEISFGEERAILFRTASLYDGLLHYR